MGDIDADGDVDKDDVIMLQQWLLAVPDRTRSVAYENMYVKDPDTGEYVLYSIFAEQNGLPMLNGAEDIQYFPLGLCFTDDSDDSSAIIAYKGTTGRGEWEDNAQAASEYATGPQHAIIQFMQGTVDCIVEMDV